MKFSHHEDFISDMALAESSGTLVVTSGDGRLSAINLKAGKVEGVSDQIEDELLSVAIMKGGKKVVAGTQDGVLNIYSWGKWADLDDRHPGHPQSIDAMLKLDEDTLITGSSDGILRVVGVQPSKLYGVLGEHEDYPIEGLSWSFDRSLIASISHDDTVRFWDARILMEPEGDEGGAGAAEPGAFGAAVAAAAGMAAAADASVQAAAAEQDSDDMDDSDDSSDGPGPADRYDRLRRAMPTKREQFFSDL